MTKYILKFLLFFTALTPCYLLAQNKVLDSLKNELQNYTEPDTTKVNLLNRIAFKSYRVDIDKTLEYADSAYKTAKSLDYFKGMATSQLVKGIYYDIKSEYPKAIEHYQQALTVFEELKDKSAVSACHHNIGVIYKLMGDFETALRYYYNSLEVEKELNNKEGISTSLNTIANIYSKQKNYDKAIDYYNKALKLFTELDDQGGKTSCMNNLGNVYLQLKDHKKAKELFQQSLAISTKIGEKYYEAPNYVSLGLLCLEENNPRQAYNYGKKAYAIADGFGAVRMMKESAELLSKSSKALGIYKEAYKYHVIFKNLNDSLVNEDRVKKITALEYQYKFDREKHEMIIEQQKKDAINQEKARQQRIIRNALFIGFILLLLLIGFILYAFIIKRKANEKLKIQKEEIQRKNIAQIKLNEEIQMQAELLKTLNATKDKFFSIIAHDLKSPFSSVLGLTESLLEDHADIDHEEREFYIKRIYNSSTTVYKFLENLLTWAQHQIGGMTMKIERFRVCELINGIKLLLKESIVSKNITITVECGSEFGILADKNMIETVIRNLISNAIKFTPKGGEICISTEIKKEGSISTAIISVKDSGVGIPPEIKSKLFKITENISTIGTEEETGTGLGLILCKEFIEQHGGIIWVESEPGKGSSFYFSLPQNIDSEL